MQHYPSDDYIFGDYIMSGMNDKNISQLLNYLNSDNLRIIHISKNNKFSNTSYWYQVPYCVHKISKDKLSLWKKLSTPNNNSRINNSLYLPKENPYITGKPKVFENVNNHRIPTKIEDSNGLSVWYKQDITFKVPKGYIYIGIDSPYSIASITNIAMTRLFVDLYTHTVIEENYDAELASIHYSLYAHQGGVTLKISGLSENQPILLEKLLYRMKNHYVSQKNFDLFKKKLIAQWQNSDKNKSISQLFSSLSSLMQPNNPSSVDLLNALDDVTFDEYNHFSNKLFEKITLEVLIHGNWLIEHAQKIISSLKQLFEDNYNSEYEIQCPVIDITSNQSHILPLLIPEHDHATVIYYPLQTRKHKSIALAMVTSHLLSPFFFQEIRNEKQYGYLVGVGYVPINRYPGIAFYIQSPDTDGITLMESIDEFITQSLEIINELTDNDWSQLIQGLAGQLREKDNNLRIKSQRFWAAICNKDIMFNHKEQLVKSILSIELKEVRQFISDQLMKASSPDRLTLISYQTEEALISQKMQFALKNDKLIKPNDFIKKNKRKI